MSKVTDDLPPLLFNRNVLSDFPEKLEKVAAKRPPAERDAMIERAALVREWLKQPETRLRCLASRDIWKRLTRCASVCGCEAMAMLIPLKVNEADVVAERERERAAEAVELRKARMELEASEDAIEPVDPNIDGDDVSRVKGQNKAILERLQQGPATNLELGEICLRYSARIHDLKRAGYDVHSRRLEGSVWQFWIG